MLKFNIFENLGKFETKTSPTQGSQIVSSLTSFNQNIAMPIPKRKELKPSKGFQLTSRSGKKRIFFVQETRKEPRRY